MSRTIRNKIKSIRWRRNKSNTMKAYAPAGSWKYTPDRSEMATGYMKGVSKTAKLEARNANRSLKKTVRQKAKQEITKQLTIE